MEDNDAAVKIIRSGRNPSIRHMGRTHNVDLAFLHECLQNGHYTTEYCKSAAQAADIFTKEIRDAASWNRVCRLIGLAGPGEWWPRGKAEAVEASPSPRKLVKQATGAPAAKKTQDLKARRLVDFCCNRNSVLGSDIPGAEDCEVVRLTIDDDVTTVKGLRKAMTAVRKPGTLLWSSQPCTGGSPWQRLNRKRPGVAEKIRAHQAKARDIWKAFVATARRAHRADPSVVDAHLQEGIHAFLARDYAAAQRILRALLLPIAEGDLDLGHDELVDEVLGVDVGGCATQYVVATYMTAPPTGRARSSRARAARARAGTTRR
jgi:hypothetical protein